MFNGLSENWPADNNIPPYIRPPAERAHDFDLVNQGGEDGLNPNDLSSWLFLTFNCPEGPYRGNYDCTNQGTVDPNDLSIWLRVFFAARSASNCGGAGAKCP